MKKLIRLYRRLRMAWKHRRLVAVPFRMFALEYTLQRVQIRIGDGRKDAMDIYFVRDEGIRELFRRAVEAGFLNMDQIQQEIENRHKLHDDRTRP